jgi:xyloglucan-specific endo-beta-1,4-glucanase
MQFTSVRSAQCAALFLAGSLSAGCDVASSSTGEKFSCRAPVCANKEPQENACEHGARISLGKYWVNNNLWGVERTNIPGEQCIWSTCNTDAGIAWGTNYSWFGGPTSQVESYTAAILGWHFNTIDPASGLPVQLSENRSVACTWNYRLTPDVASSQNVAYDIWLSDTNSPTGATVPTDEVMIWLYHSGGASPIGGSAKETVEIGGGRWNLHEGSTGGWRVHSFVRTSNAPCAELNLRDFFKVLVDEGLSADKYLIGIEAGTEVFSGQGKLETDYYACDVQ